MTEETFEIDKKQLRDSLLIINKGIAEANEKGIPSITHAIAMEISVRSHGNIEVVNSAADHIMTEAFAALLEVN